MPEIENYKKIIIDLISYAEEETQRENLYLLVELFKNKFRYESTLMKNVWEIEDEIYKLTSQGKVIKCK